jgi:hypothetical protein
MRWAIIDRKSQIVKEIVEADEPPRVERDELAVKGHCETCAVGRKFDGWTFAEVPK